MLQEGHPACHFASPALRRQGVGVTIREDTFEPSLQYGGEMQPEHRGNECKTPGILHLLPLCNDVFGSVVVNELRHCHSVLVTEPTRSDEPPNRASGGVQDALLEVHLIQDFEGNTFMHVAGEVLHAKYRIESNSVQVNHFAGVAGVLQTPGELLENGVTK